MLTEPWVKTFCVGFNIDYIHDSALVICCSNILNVLHHSLTICTISTFAIHGKIEFCVDHAIIYLMAQPIPSVTIPSPGIFREFVTFLWKSCKCPKMGPDGSYKNPTVGLTATTSFICKTMQVHTVSVNLKKAGLASRNIVTKNNIRCFKSALQ